MRAMGPNQNPNQRLLPFFEIIMQQTALQDLAESNATAPAGSIITNGFGL